MDNVHAKEEGTSEQTSLLQPMMEAKRPAPEPPEAVPASKKAKKPKGFQLPNGVTPVNLAPSDTFCKIFMPEDVQQQQRVLMAVVWKNPRASVPRVGSAPALQGHLLPILVNCSSLLHCPRLALPRRMGGA
jgi:hypothetical protein